VKLSTAGSKCRRWLGASASRSPLLTPLQRYGDGTLLILAAALILAALLLSALPLAAQTGDAPSDWGYVPATRNTGAR
jgi:hypothetical protein